MGYRRSPTEAVLTAIVARLASSTGVTGLATNGIATHIQQGVVPPMVEVTAPTDHRVDTFGRKGAETVVQVRALTSGESQQPGSRLRDQCVRALTNAALSATGHVVNGVEYESGTHFWETVNGVPYQHHIGLFRVWTEQSSS